MDPSSDQALHFHHHRQGQRHQRLGSPLPSGSPAASSSSQPQGPTSPSASTAASSNPFVRSHHDHLPAQPARMMQDQRATTSTEQHTTSLSRTASSSSLSKGDEISVAVKCPSLDKDSAVVKVKASDTVRILKHTIERTWPGAPRADGMRCIRSGRILNDAEILGQLSQNHEGTEPLSLHLVIRPDAWSDPQNRPTPSRRSSYLRQQQQQQQQQHQSFVRSALAAQLPTGQSPEDDVLPRLSALSNPSHSGWTPQFEPYFSDANTRERALSTSNLLEPQSGIDAFTGSAAMVDNLTGQTAVEPNAVLEEILRVTAPENWPTLVEALTAACNEYVLMYETIYNDALAAQKPGLRPASPSTLPASQSDLLTSIETTLLGWQPIQRPGEVRTAASLSQSDTEYLYQQISHRGLPYLLRISTTPIDRQRSEALHTLLQRITTLRTMTDKLENMIALGRLFHDGTFTRAATTSNIAMPPPLNGSATARQAMALEQGGVVATATRFVRSAGQSIRSLTFADVTAVIIPMMFVAFKVGILLSVMLRGADKTKMYLVLGMASMYFAFESYRIVQRRMRLRQQTTARPAPAPAPGPAPAQQPNPAPLEQPNPTPLGQPNLAPVEQRNTAPAQQPAGPMGTNVPTAPSHEETVERQATEEPLRPLPPPQAPPRFRSRTRFSYDWWIDHMAFIGLDAEDEELGLLPAPGTTAPTHTGSGVVSRLLTSSWILPMLLFLFTMMPAVEQHRKRAIEERERVIRKWTRLEQERRQRAAELLRQQEQTKEEHGDVVDEAERNASESEQRAVEIKRAEYADRMLRQRRTTEAIDVDEEDRTLMQALAQGDGDDEVAMEDMNIF